MTLHHVRVHPESDRLPREAQLAWHIAAVAADPTPIDPDIAEMIGNRIIDNAAVAIASLNRPPIVAARAQALAHPRAHGATLFGSTTTVHCEWAAWANGVAVRELDYHDTYLAADYSHPGDNIPPILAVAQQMGLPGAALLPAIATAYEIQVALTRAICLHAHKIDHVAHLGPSAAAGIGTLLTLPPETIYQAIQHALHVTTATRQSRKGEISTWKAFAPAHATKLAIEAVDRAMRGQTAPSPIYEGEDSVIAWLLGGKSATYDVALPAKGEPKRAILETYTKEHSAEYQSQALIDLAFRMRRQIPNIDAIDSIVIHTSHHTHNVIGTGANDPQKFDPNASRETLDHSIMYIFAVALQDGAWHHVNSYTPARARRPDTKRLWHKISTIEDPAWTTRYHAQDPTIKAFGGRVVITLTDGTTITDELAVANAHTLGATPWRRPDYIKKFRVLTDTIVTQSAADIFLDAVDRLPTLRPDELTLLTIPLPQDALQLGRNGIF